MVSPDKADRDVARKRLSSSKDEGQKWTKSEWKNEPDAADIGVSIGADSAAEDDKSFRVGWVERGKEGMEQVNAGLSVF